LKTKQQENWFENTWMLKNERFASPRVAMNTDHRKPIMS
jgi:hypothetical protein